MGRPGNASLRIATTPARVAAEEEEQCAPGIGYTSFFFFVATEEEEETMVYIFEY